MELGSMMYPMVDVYLMWINQDVSATAKMTNINLPGRLTTPLMEAPRKSTFIDVLKASQSSSCPLCWYPLTDIPHAFSSQGPCLCQVSYPDAFWNSGVINYDLIGKAFNALEKLNPGEHPSGSWNSVMMMLVRRDGDVSDTYSENSSLRSLIRGAMERINQCAKDSVVQVTSKFAPDTPPQDQSDSLAGIRSAGSFLWRRIQGLGGSSQTKGTAPLSPDGLGFLLKRIHEMLLGLALVFESHTIITKETECGLKKGISHADLKRLKAELSGDCIFRSGPPGVTSKAWTTARREAYASLAVFAAFGVAGWFTIMANWRRYHLADIYGIMTLAHQKTSILVSSEDNSLDTSHPLRCGSWKYLNGHIIRLIHSCNFHTPNPNWFAMQKSWVEALEPATVAELLLLDIYTEVPFPKPSISRSGRATQLVKIDDIGQRNREWLQKSIGGAFPEMARPPNSIPYPPPPPMSSAPQPSQPSHEEQEDNNEEEENDEEALNRDAAALELQMTAAAAPQGSKGKGKSKTSSSKSTGSRAGNKRFRSQYIDDEAGEA